VQEDERLALRVAALLEVHAVQLRDRQLARAIGLDLGEELAQSRLAGLARFMASR
jgi:hypothetical protein